MANVLAGIAIVLVIIGGLNWLLISLFNFNLVEWINQYTFKNEWFPRVIYFLVGLATVYFLYYAIKNWNTLIALQ